MSRDHSKRRIDSIAELAGGETAAPRPVLLPIPSFGLRGLITGIIINSPASTLRLGERSRTVGYIGSPYISSSYRHKYQC